MKDDLNCFPMQEDLNFFLQMKDNLIFCQMDDNLNLIQMEYNLNVLANGRQPKKKIMQPKTINIKTMVVAPLRVTLFLLICHITL